METASLALLERPEARRLVAAWPQVGKKRPRHIARTLHADWASAAGVREVVAETLGESLRRAGICEDGGKVAPEAERFLVSAARSGVGIEA